MQVSDVLRVTGLLMRELTDGAANRCHRALQPTAARGCIGPRFLLSSDAGLLAPDLSRSAPTYTATCTLVLRPGRPTEQGSPGAQLPPTQADLSTHWADQDLGCLCISVPGSYPVMVLVTPRSPADPLQSLAFLPSREGMLQRLTWWQFDAIILLYCDASVALVHVPLRPIRAQWGGVLESTGTGPGSRNVLSKYLLAVKPNLVLFIRFTKPHFFVLFL